VLFNEDSSGWTDRQRNVGFEVLTAVRLHGATIQKIAILSQRNVTVSGWSVESAEHVAGHIASGARSAGQVQYEAACHSGC
jgi:hypothetical protein